MNKFLIICMGLSLIAPAQLHSLSKQKVTAAAKIIIGTASAVCAVIILKNIAVTAHRRIANPEYQGSKSFATILGQMSSILLHNKELAAIVLAAAGLSAFCLYSGIQDLIDDKS